MSDEQQKPRGRVFGLKAKAEKVAPGKLTHPVIPITSEREEQGLPKTTEAPVKVVPEQQRKSLLIFGEKKKAPTPGLEQQQPSIPVSVAKVAPKPTVQQPVAKPTQKPAEEEPKPTKIRFASQNNVKLITPLAERQEEAKAATTVGTVKKTFDPALLALKAEFDYIKDLYEKEDYADIDLVDLHNPERDEEVKGPENVEGEEGAENVEGEEGAKGKREFYIFINAPLEVDFSDVNAEFETLEFTPDGFYIDKSTDEKNGDSVLELFRLYDQFLEIEEEEKRQKEEAEKAKVKKPITKVNMKELEPLADAILREEGRLPGETLQEKLEDKYKIAKPVEGYIPTTHRNFSSFIFDTFRAFQLPKLPSVIDPKACVNVLQADRSQMYLYQQFVKEYLSWQTPYRGILVYHGLGSGKTCTSIAAAEALFSTNTNSRIIVMTPFSLRQNFIGEITTCGFHHYRLKNFWQSFPLSDPRAVLFAKSVLKIPDQYLARVNKIYIPDFSKPSNYETLPTQTQTEIREQITNTLVYDPKKGYFGRIWFISYNGITAKELLRIACTQNDAFDNSIIIVDEIHNLIRIMQGTIEPYISDLKPKGQSRPGEKKKEETLKRKIAKEPITWEKWKPSLCPAEWSTFEKDKALQKKNYKRGYLFYRLLIQAQNSKIIGLSGTPLINFPEELGILANVIHGYLHIVEGNIQKPTMKKGGTDAADQALATKLIVNLQNNPFVDFYKVDILDQTIRFRVTFLPEGIRKVKGQKGVERVNPEEPLVDFAGRLSFLQSDLEGNGFPLLIIAGTKNQKLKVDSQPILPPIGSEFKDTFIDEKDTVSIKNQILLMKRLTGLVSYYKGNRDDLMPTISKDETVFVPMSSYQQTVYSKARSKEIAEEEKKEKQKPSGEVPGRLAALYALVYEIKDTSQSANYRMASRQVCNFAFPPEVNRPEPKTKAEQERETGEDTEDIQDMPAPEGEDLGTTLAKEKEAEEEVQEEEKAIKEDLGEVEDEAILIQGDEDEEEEIEEFDENAIRAKAKDDGFNDEEIETMVVFAQQEYEDRIKAKVDAAAAATAKTQAKTALTAEQRKCRAVRLPTETKYQEKIDRAINCLATTAKSKLMMTPTGLGETSPKFLKMLENIRAAKGSSLVYSQFLQMEGIGIFALAMKANGYEPIEIKFAFSQNRVYFTEETKKSLAKGPSPDPETNIKQFRYIKFTGAEEDIVRRYSLLLFNGRFSELPKDLSKFLTDAGWKNNDFGDLCRVFCITAAGAEGLSLKNVRAVHIMEPYWNDVRTAQVKGRAVRICSHAELDPEERTVDVFTYVSVFSEKAQMIPLGETGQILESIRNRDSITTEEALVLNLPVPKGAKQYVLTSDLRLWFISNYKKTLINNLQTIMKQSAVDCKLNKFENKESKEMQCASFTSTGEPKTPQSLIGKIGDFLYDPDFETDLKLSQEMTAMKPAAKTVTTAVTKPAVTVAQPTVVQQATTASTTASTTVAKPVEKGSGKFFKGEIEAKSGVFYAFEPVMDGEIPKKYFIYPIDAAKRDETTRVGEVGAKFSEKRKVYEPDKTKVKFYAKPSA